MTYRIEMTDQAENDLREILEYVAFSLLAPDNAVRLLNRLEDIAIQEIIKEYQRQKTNQRSRKGGSARKPQQYHAEAEVII